MTTDTVKQAGNAEVGKPAPAVAKPAPAVAKPAVKPAPAVAKPAVKPAPAVAKPAVKPAVKPAGAKPAPAAKDARVIAPAPGNKPVAAAKPAPIKTVADVTVMTGSPGPDFATLKTVEELVDVYNDMVPTATDLAVPKVGTVKSFPDIKTGKLACERLHALIMKAREPVTVKKETTVTKTKAAKKTKTAKKTRAPRAGAFAPDAKVMILSKELAYRGGRKARATKVLALGTGKTVETHLAKGTKTSTLRRMIADKLIKVV